jgi:hypothetical protein
MDMAHADVFDSLEISYNQARGRSHVGGVSAEALERLSVLNRHLS